jgi:transposase
VREQIPQATVCLDPFHVIKWTNEVVESVYRAKAPKIPVGARYDPPRGQGISDTLIDLVPSATRSRPFWKSASGSW